MDVKIIKTERDYRKALARLEKIFDAKSNTKEGEELEVLSFLIEKYENEHFPIELPDPIEAIRFRMEQLSYRKKDLSDVLGYKSRATEILSKKRKLSIQMIRQLHENLNIPANVLIQAY